MPAILLALLFVFTPAIGNAQQNAFVTVAPQPESEAWWLRAEYHPFGTEVRGIPVRKLHANWRKATEFRKDLFPPELAKDLDDTGGFTFAEGGNFDGSKTKQTALLGVYETCAGEQGTFLIVLSWPKTKTNQPKIRFVHELGLTHQFSVLSVSADSTITVQHCLECDHTSKFKWNGKRRTFVLLPPDPEE